MTWQEDFAAAWAKAPMTLQNEAELRELFGIVRERGCKSFLEIGSKAGGSLYILAHALPAGSRVVSIDPKPVSEGIAMLRQAGYDVSQIVGKSQDPAIIERCQGFDFVHIDGDHSYQAARKDFENYPAPLVALHDVNNPDMGVSRFWRDLQGDKTEIFLAKDRQHMGIGVVEIR